MAEYNFQDPLVVELVRGHQPIEITTGGMTLSRPEPGVLVTQVQLDVVCGREYEPWPCAAVTALRAFESARERVAAQAAAAAAAMSPRHG